MNNLELENKAVALNEMMLERGNPQTTGKDDTGYNTVDFNHMYWTSLIPREKMSKAVILDIIHTLSTYRFTQLKNEGIPELMDYRKKCLREMQDEKNVNRADLNADLNKQVKDAKEQAKKTMRVVGEIDGAVVISNMGYDPALNNFIHSTGTIRNRKIDNEWHIVMDRSENELELLDGFNKIGYNTDELRDYFKSHKIDSKAVRDARRAKAIAVTEDYIAVRMPRSNVISDMIRSNKIYGRWEKNREDDQWDFLLNIGVADEFCDKLEGDNIASDEIRNAIALAKEKARKKEARENADKEKAARENAIISLKEIKPVEPECAPYKPYQFQLDDVAEMLNKRKIILGNEMGCGKTHECVRVGYSLKMNKLVVCPPSLRINWVKEIQMCEPDADVAILYSNTKEEELIAHEWTIVGYSSMDKLLPYLSRMNFKCIFADEAHFIKACNTSGKPTSKRAEAVLALAKKAEFAYAITGTPKPNRNRELYNILKFIDHPLGHMRFFDYGREFCDGYKDTFGWNFDGNSNDDELFNDIKPYMIRHLKKDVLPDLKKQRQSIPVTANLTEYNRLMKQVRQAYAKKHKDQSDSGDILALLMKARQCLAVSKVKETQDFVSDLLESGESVVVVTCFTEVVEKLTAKFKDISCKVVGGMSDKEKQKSIEDFQNGKKQLIILNMVAGGVGITLTKAHLMVINDFSWVPGEIVQVEDRICRSGQKELCLIYYMTADGVDVEKRILTSLTKKSDTINAAVDGGDNESVNYIKMAIADTAKERS